MTIVLHQEKKYAKYAILLQNNPQINTVHSLHPNVLLNIYKGAV